MKNDNKDKIIIIRIYAKDTLRVGRKMSGENPELYSLAWDMRILMFDTPNLNVSQV